MPIDRKKQESCEKYEPPEVLPLGELDKLTFGSTNVFVDMGRYKGGGMNATSWENNPNDENPEPNEK